jgi:hypothetical protein
MIFSVRSLTGGDEDLGAGDLVAAIALRDRAAAQEPEIGTAMRLGQAHVPDHWPLTILGR